jgi:hypothetical protein
LWAVVVSNHRPPPCKGEAKVLVSGVSRSDRVSLSAPELLCRCYAEGSY